MVPVLSHRMGAPYRRERGTGGRRPRLEGRTPAPPKKSSWVMPATPGPTNPIGVGAELAGYLVTWLKAVDLQRDRVLTGADDFARHTDSYLYALALHQVLRAATAIQGLSGDFDLKTGLEAFLSDVPDAQNLRDVLTHFDEYTAGQGRLQRRKQMGPLIISLGRGDKTVFLMINDFHLEVGRATESAHNLASAALDAEMRFRRSRPYSHGG
jgi:hypothetical protein